MKLLALIAFSFALTQSLHAQGTYKFTVEANGQGAVPPNNSVDNAGGPFFLTGNIFSCDIGWVTTTSTAGGTLLAIRDSAGTVLFPTDRIESQDVGGPFGFAYAFWDERPLTGAQIDDLMAGNWFLVMSNDAFPNGELRGQLQLVPEPSIFAVFGVGFLALLIWQKRSVRQRLPSNSSVPFFSSRENLL